MVASISATELSLAHAFGTTLVPVPNRSSGPILPVFSTASDAKLGLRPNKCPVKDPALRGSKGFNEMKKIFTNAGLGAVIALSAFAIPGQATTVLSFATSGTGTAGSVTTPTNYNTGTSGSMNSNFSVSNFSTLQESIDGGADVWNWNLTNSSLVWNSTTDQLTLSADMTCQAGSGCGNYTTGSAVSLLTIQLSAAPTYTISKVGPSYNLSVAINNATSITETAAFLTATDLNPSNPTLTAESGSIASSGTNSATTTAWTPGSSTLDLTTNQVSPEPVTFLLFGSGLLAVAFIARRNSRNAVAVKAE